MCSHSPTAASIKMEISLSRAAMIELVRFGIPILELSFIHLKDIKMQSIVWALMFPMAAR